MGQFQKPSAVKCSLKSSGLAFWQDGGPNCREDAYGQPRLRPEDAVPLHSWGSGHAVPLQVPLRELLVHQGHGSWIRYGLHFCRLLPIQDKRQQDALMGLDDQHNVLKFYRSPCFIDQPHLIGRFRPALAITFKMVSGVKDENVRGGRKQGSRSRLNNIWSSKEPHSQRQKKSIPYMSLVICLGSFLGAKPSHPALTTYFRAQHPSPTFPFILSTNRDGNIRYLTTQSLYFENFI